MMLNKRYAAMAILTATLISILTACGGGGGSAGGGGSTSCVLDASTLDNCTLQ